MITLSNLPKKYKPYPLLNVCGNTIIDGGHILSVGDILPLVVGSGSKPLIWLQGIRDSKTRKFIPLVKESKATNSLVRVLEIEDQIIVLIRNSVVLRIEWRGREEATIHELDFRFIGLNVYANKEGISAGDMHISHSSFSSNGDGNGVLIGFDV